MARTVRPLLAGVLTVVIALSGCASQVNGAAAGGNVGPSVAVSSPDPSGQESAPTTPEVTSGGSTGEESTEPTTGEESTEPTTGEESTEPTTGEGTTSGTADADVQEFVAMVADGMSGVTSYQGKISTDMGSATGGSMTGTMRGTVKDGKAENSEATIGIGVGSQSIEVKLLMVGTKTYIGGSTFLAAVPEARGKTWIYADPNSSNPTIKQLAASMSAAGGSNSSIESFTKFAAAAKSVEKGDSSTVNGVDVTAYKVVLDPSELGSSAATADSATATFYLDGDNRMRRAKVDVGAGGMKVVVTMDMTDYNTPVDIKAPAADTVYTG